jgi:hypothetical protein
VKVFLDANVLFSAALPGSRMGDFVRYLKKHAELASSPAAADEALRNVERKLTDAGVAARNHQELLKSGPHLSRSLQGPIAPFEQNWAYRPRCPVISSPGSKDSGPDGTSMDPKNGSSATKPRMKSWISGFATLYRFWFSPSLSKLG